MTSIQLYIIPMSKIGTLKKKTKKTRYRRKKMLKINVLIEYYYYSIYNIYIKVSLCQLNT